MKNLKKLTLFHSNDMHGDFAAEQIDKNLVGGVSMLSGYINKVRVRKRMSSMQLRATCSEAPSSTPSSGGYQPSR